MTRDFAWTAVIDSEGFTLGGAFRGESGYSPMREPEYFDTWERASIEADLRNESMGLTASEALDIVASSMRAQNVGIHGARAERNS